MDECFITTIIPLLKPGNSTGVPSYSTIRGSVWRLSQSLVFHYKDWTLSAHERMRIDTLLHKYLQDGQLANEPRRIKQWVGALVVQKIAMAMLVDALSNGCHNWDVTLQKVTSVVLCAALQARVGDIGKNRLDAHLDVLSDLIPRINARSD